MSSPKTSKLHSKNKHKSGYDFNLLCKSYPLLKEFVFINKYNATTIDFAIPQAVKALNKALLKVHYGIDYWQFPDKHLCPPIPGRADYLHYLNDLLKTSNLKDNITVLDIGTGATCIYPLIGDTEYGWNFIASDIDQDALKISEDIIRNNNLESHIELKFQNNASKILEGIISTSDRLTACMCNPPFYKSENEAIEATKRKLKGLGNTKAFERNFSGTANELWYRGGEKAFLHNYLYESSLYKTNCFWYTSLVSNKNNIKSMKQSLAKLGAEKVKVIEMLQGNKITRIVAWTFLNKEAQKEWN